jgi:hypothetical protein
MVMDEGAGNARGYAGGAKRNFEELCLYYSSSKFQSLACRAGNKHKDSNHVRERLLLFQSERLKSLVGAEINLS